MKTLSSSNYDNKEVINHIKSSFSILESSKSTFSTSEFLEIEMVSVFKKDDVYTVELNNIKCPSLCSEWSEKKQFTSRTKAIKYILFNIGVINKEELNKTNNN
tara:strand:+ start:378 stop:686 length:309 start_codon:yes stop_codon:yes gene_type:complete